MMMKFKVLADTLRQASAQTVDSEAYEEFQTINMVLFVSEERYEEFQNETKVHPKPKTILIKETRSYCTFRCKVAIADGFLFKEHS